MLQSSMLRHCEPRTEFWRNNQFAFINCFVACASRNDGEVFHGRVFSAWIFVSVVFDFSAAFFKIFDFEVFLLKNKIFSRFSFCVFKKKVFRRSDFCAFSFLWLFGQFFFLYSKSFVSGCVPRPVQCGSNSGRRLRPA